MDTNRSLYDISNELLAIFAEIEDSEGEVTEEQLEALTINEKDLDKKLSSYKKAIRCWESDINACKEEEKRIKAARNVKENRIEKLKNKMLFAVQHFGYEGKPNKKGKTNRFYELADGRIFTRCTESVELNENRINVLKNLLIEVCKNEHLFNDVEKIDLYRHILDHVNQLVDTYYEGMEHFTLDDLSTAKFTYTANLTPYDMIRKYSHLIKDSSEFGTFTGLEYATDKAYLKLKLNVDNDLTVAKIKETESITIK